MKLFLVIGLLGLVGFMPFVLLRRPWAVRLWSQIKLVVVVYVIVVFMAALLRLVFNWGDIYG